MANRDLERVRDWERCSVCGARLDQHGQDVNPHRPYACPAKAGNVPSFPSQAFQRKHGEKAAQDLYGKRLARHWTARKTVFS